MNRVGRTNSINGELETVNVPEQEPLRGKCYEANDIGPDDFLFVDWMKGTYARRDFVNAHGWEIPQPGDPHPAFFELKCRPGAIPFTVFVYRKWWEFWKPLVVNVKHGFHVYYTLVPRSEYPPEDYIYAA